MAIVQKASNSLASVASFSPSLTGVTAGNTLVLLVGASAFADTTPTDSAVQTWAKVGYLANSGCEVAVYWLQSANAGTHNLTVSHGGSAFPSWSLVEIPSCTAVDVFGTLASASNTATTLSTNAITTTNASDAVFVLFAADVSTGSSNAAITDPPTGYTSVFAQQNTASFAGVEFGYKEVSSTGSQSATWTFNADTTGSLYAAVAVSFKLSASAGAALAGAGRAIAVGSGALTPKAQFFGAGTATASGSATLGGGAALSGAGSASAKASGTLTVTPKFAGAGTAATSGSGVFTVPSSGPITLKQRWYQAAGVGNPPSLVQGSNPMTVTAGTTLIVVWSAADNGAVNPPTDSAGTFTTPTGGLINVNGSTHIWLGIAHQANAAGGSHILTPPNLAVGGGGEIGIWVYEVSGMPATINIRGIYSQNPISTSQSWTLTTDSLPQAGDIAFTATTYENTATWVNANLTDPPSGWTSLGAIQDATNFIPTEIAYQIVPASGAISSGWSTTDTGVSEHLAITMVLVPAGTTFAGAGIATAAGSGALTARPQFSGSGSSGGLGVGALTTRAPLAGSGSAAVSGSASLRTAAAPAGAGLAQAAGSAALTVSAVFAGAGSVNASGSGSLTTGSSGANLAGAGVASASGAAALTTASALAGAGICRAGGAASLTVSSALAGSGSAAASGSATLTGGSAAVSFIGSGNAQATGSGALTTAAALAGGGFSIATAAGTLSIGGGGVAFAGNGAATTAGIAALTARPRFSGAGVATATGSGEFAVASAFVSGNDAVWLVPARNTVAAVPHRMTVAQATTD
jgi:hypothetical protein